jgi:KpsF/GutQ family protein
MKKEDCLLQKEFKMLKEVLIKERDAITKMIEETDSQYDEILDLFSNCKGKLVFMGVGKSAHIGKKLAATFASLGIPSFFVHSTEAMHGDLGMIEKTDIAILISNSGNTSEVVQNVEPLKRNGVTTVAFTAGKDSKLASACDYLLSYPKLAEADALNLAPTVSSTLTLVLGDAIACELSSRKNFTREDFYKFHPNGALGEMLKKEQK